MKGFANRFSTLVLFAFYAIWSPAVFVTLILLTFTEGLLRLTLATPVWLITGFKLLDQSGGFMCPDSTHCTYFGTVLSDTFF